jgi:hypothetical protein
VKRRAISSGKRRHRLTLLAGQHLATERLRVARLKQVCFVFLVQRCILDTCWTRSRQPALTY